MDLGGLSWWILLQPTGRQKGVFGGHVANSKKCQPVARFKDVSSLDFVGHSPPELNSVTEVSLFLLMKIYFLV